MLALADLASLTRYREEAGLALAAAGVGHMDYPIPSDTEHLFPIWGTVTHVTAGAMPPSTDDPTFIPNQARRI